MYSVAEENYLKSLFNLAGEDGAVQLNELGRWLDIKMSSVNSMMKRFAEKGLIYYENYKPVRLTEKGKREAALVIRKHRLTEMYLVDKMGFGWEQVHAIAEQLEHVHSQEFFDKMDEILGFPAIDPHGSPIPDKDGRMADVVHKKLGDCAVGDTATLVAVSQSSSAFLEYLNAREIRLGQQVTIAAIEPFDRSMRVAYGDDRSEVLSSKVCDMLLVR